VHPFPKKNIYIVEDAAQALGSSYKNQQAGSIGDLAAFSFHETKNVISGEGGALIINNPKMIERAEVIREKGTNRSQFFRGQVDKYTWVDLGSSFLPGELIAAFLYAQLLKEDNIFARRLDMWQAYDEALRPLSAKFGFKCPDPVPDTVHNGHMYYLQLPDLASRQAFIASMKAKLIYTPFHYVPLHSAPAGQRYGSTPASMAVTDKVSDTLVRLPIFYSLDEQDRVIAAVKETVEEILI
ncbi:MAG: hypothetical protein EX271_07235, partial [Acidimicrobiales bacterium]